ncbi:hypothetical protein NE237_028223 [Protea cynaroides]|uniref:Transmembrane protein n=1 Tax=Protea cynaroides TaxID=273540 RepID=A0A9Q0JTN5_9MAGN|nr:hypothetical protein NE237_028223 [Protea cynaroides]
MKQDDTVEKRERSVETFIVLGFLLQISNMIFGLLRLPLICNLFSVLVFNLFRLSQISACLWCFGARFGSGSNREREGAVTATADKEKKKTDREKKDKRDIRLRGKLNRKRGSSSCDSRRARLQHILRFSPNIYSFGRCIFVDRFDLIRLYK